MMHGAQRHRTRGSFRGGFSLLEVLIALALLTAMMGTMFSFFFEMLSTRERVIAFTNEKRGAGVLIERLHRDLQTCIVGDATLGAGVKGDETSLRILTRSVPVRLVEESENSGPFSDTEVASYRFTAGRGRIELGRAVAAPGTKDDEPVMSVVAEGVFRVRFRFHDGAMWTDSFDSMEADRLPRAIEIAIWYDPWPSALLDEEPVEEDGEVDEGEGFVEDWGEGAFDERAYAEMSDAELSADPPPDRIRVIIIPDAHDDGDAAPDGEGVNRD